MIKVALLGPKGTFTDLAYIKYNNIILKQSSVLEDAKTKYLKSIDEVVREVKESSCLGIIPVENTLDGYVQRTLDLLLEEEMFAIDEVIVPVNFSLIANCKDINEIRNIYVQFKANGQCRKLINSLHNANIITTNSNMESFYSLSSENYTDAAIVPSHIKASDKLTIENIADSSNNYTRFFVITTKENVNKNNQLINDLINSSLGEKQYNKVKVNVCIIPENDRPGLLFDILSSIYENHINMVSIMSRPTKNDLGTYNFFIEMEVLREEEDVVFKTIDLIKAHNKYDVDIKILGKYYL